MKGGGIFKMKENLDIKYLEMIQSIINRLANNSFLIKGWSISIVVAGFGLYFSIKERLILYTLLFPIIMFWYLDSFYLREERIFRSLYDANAIIDKGRKDKNDFSINRKKYESRVPNMFKTMVTSNCLLQYVTAIIMIEIFFINYLLRR